jgi:hypothetical protein
MAFGNGNCVTRLGVFVCVALSLLWALPLGAGAAGDANEAICPNEAWTGFSPYLAGCRAYELVSPPFKEGTRLGGVQIAGDGSSVLASSLGAFVGAEGDTTAAGAAYRFTRRGSGWTASAESPSSAVFETSRRVAASRDFSRTLFATHRPTQAAEVVDLYVREADGALAEVGPMAPPAAEAGPPTGASQTLDIQDSYASASADLSHIAFELEGERPRWPGDTTLSVAGAESLYEYIGTGNREPSLVGLNSEGHVISDCSTVLGDGVEGFNTHNAVSASGETVFFTAVGHTPEGHGCEESVSAPAVSELYARLRGAQTVAISEPSGDQCAECNTTAPRPAEFQGASEDGSKAFFLTEQELLPGTATNNLYEYDFDAPAGQKIVRVSTGSPAPEVQGVTRVSEDGSHVYFVAKAVLTSEPNGSLAPGHQVAQAGAENLYLFERDAAYPSGRMAFVAALSEADSRDWRATDARPVQATPDGRFLVFTSVADITPGDTAEEPQVFEYDALDGMLVRASIGQAGYPAGSANADAHASELPLQEYRPGVSPTQPNSGLAISADGSRVLFSSAGALTPRAEAAQAVGAQSVYEYRSSGSVADGAVYLISNGRDGVNAITLGLDPAGANVFFQTAQPLLPQDGDTQYDIYDAREDGGFPIPLGSPACEGDACRGAPTAPPVLGLPGSLSILPGGNLQPQAAPPPRASGRQAARAALAGALRHCRRLPRRKRAACEARARRRYARPHAGARTNG